MCYAITDLNKIKSLSLIILSVPCENTSVQYIQKLDKFSHNWFRSSGDLKMIKIFVYSDFKSWCFGLSFTKLAELAFRNCSSKFQVSPNRMKVINKRIF